VQTELAGHVGLIRLIFCGLRDLREYFRAVRNRQRDFFGLFVADVAHLHGLADYSFRDGIHQVGASVHRLAVDIGDDIAGLQAGFIGRAAWLYGFNDDAVGDAEFLHEHGIIAAILLESDADGAASDFAVGDELIVDVDYRRGRQREADAFEAAAAGVDGSVDADDFAGHVDERAAGISRVDGCVRLNETLKLVPDVGAVFRAYDSGSDGGIQAEGAADGEDPVADLHAVGIAELGDRQFAIRVDFYYSEVGVFIEPDDASAVLGGIAIERHLNFGGLVDYVIVGEDETLFVDDYAGAEAAFGVGAVIGRVEETVEEVLEGIAEFFGRLATFGLFDYLRSGDVDDGGAEFLGYGGEGVGKRNGIGHGEKRGPGGGLVVGGLHVSGDYCADDDADAEGENDEQRGEDFAAAHPAE